MVLLFAGCGGSGSGDSSSNSPLQETTDDVTQKNTTEKTVLDLATNLEWQDSPENTDYDLLFSWQEAIDYCENLSYAGKDDWRLPSVYELKTLIDTSKEPPAMIDGFANVASTVYMSANKLIGYAYNYKVWVVSFSSAYTNSAFAYLNDVYSTENNVRCVRGDALFGIDSRAYGRWKYINTADGDADNSIPYFVSGEYFDIDKFMHSEANIEIIDENHIKIGEKHFIRVNNNDTRIQGSLISKSNSVQSKQGTMIMIVKNAKYQEEKLYEITPTADAAKIGKNTIVKTDGSTIEVANEEVETKTKEILEASEKIEKIIVYVSEPEIGMPLELPATSPVLAPSGSTEIIVKDQYDNNVSFSVSVSGEEFDIGLMTVTNATQANAKALINYRANNSYYGYNDGEESISYSESLKVCNKGTEYLGAIFDISVDSNYSSLVRSFTHDYDGKSVIISPNGCKSYRLNFSFKRPEVPANIKINIVTTDSISGEVMSDYVAFNLSHYELMSLNLYSNSSSSRPTGYIITPERRLLSLGTKIPKKLQDSYEVVIFSSDSRNEYIYMLSSEKAPDLSLMDNFTDVNINEPDDNISSATQIKLLGGSAVGYIKNNDIDFYKLIDVPSQ